MALIATRTPQPAEELKGRQSQAPGRPVERLPALGSNALTSPAADSVASVPSPGFASLRDCAKANACKQGTACWPIGGGAICAPSECTLSGQGCRADQTCRVVSLAEKIFRCVQGGKGVEGADCTEMYPAPQNLRCAAGLSCWHGRCRRRCAADSDCAGSLRCVPASPVENLCAGDVCLTDRDCPSSRPHCIEMRDGSPSTCVGGAGGSCRPGSCGQGEACDAHLEGDSMVGRCRKACDPIHSSCGAEEVCLAPAGSIVDNIVLPSGLCYRRCSFKEPGVCRASEVCGTLGGEDSLTVCRSTSMSAMWKSRRMDTGR